MEKKKKMSKEDQVHEQLRIKMDEMSPMMPIARSPGLKKIMRLYFPTLEAAEICTYLDLSVKGNREGKTAEEIAEESGKNDVEEIREILEQLVIRTTVMKRDRPGKPGVVEYSLAHFWEMGETLSVVDEHGPLGIAHAMVMNKYYDEVALQEWSRSKHPLFRTLVVEQTVNSQSKVLSWELANELIKAHERIAIAYCGCRVREHKCDHRVDTCFLFDDFADEMVEHSKEIPGARLISHVTQEMALQRLGESFKEGLVATALNYTDPSQAYFICMCCNCCCHILGNYHQNITGWGNPYALAKSNFEPEFDNEKCVRCGACVDICPVNALWRHYPHKPDLSDDFIFHEEDRCIGCGVCAVNCPKTAITMKKVRDLAPETDIISMIDRVVKEARH